MFKNENDLENWTETQRGSFSFVMSNERLASLVEEIKSGRAIYINSTARGQNPQIKTAEKAQLDFDSRNSTESKNRDIKTRLDRAKTALRIRNGQQTPSKISSSASNNKEIAPVAMLDFLQRENFILHQQPREFI